MKDLFVVYRSYQLAAALLALWLALWFEEKLKIHLLNIWSR